MPILFAADAAQTSPSNLVPFMTALRPRTVRR